MGWSAVCDCGISWSYSLTCNNELVNFWKFRMIENHYGANVLPFQPLHNFEPLVRFAGGKIVAIVVLLLQENLCKATTLKKTGYWFSRPNYFLMQAKGIAECTEGVLLQYFRHSLNYHLSLRSLFCLFLSVRFTQVFLHMLTRLLQDLCYHYTMANSCRQQNSSGTFYPEKPALMGLCCWLTLLN